MIGPWMAVFLFLFPPPQDPKVTVDIARTGKVEALVYFVDEMVSFQNRIPLVRASLGKVEIENGRFVRRLFLSPDDRNLERSILTPTARFRVYVKPDQVGIFRYHETPREKGRPRGVYFAGLPIDRDETLKEMTAGVKEKAGLESLLEMSIEEAMQASDKETLIQKAIDRMIDLEAECLQAAKGSREFQPFLIATTRKK